MVDSHEGLIEELMHSGARLRSLATDDKESAIGWEEHEQHQPPQAKATPTLPAASATSVAIPGVPSSPMADPHHVAVAVEST